MWLLKPFERPFSYQALHGGILVASTAASHRTNEMLKILLEEVIAKLHVFIYVCVCLFIFRCGTSKYLAVFSQGISVIAVLTFMQKVTGAEGMGPRDGAEDGSLGLVSLLGSTSNSLTLSWPLRLFVLPIPPSPISYIQAVNLSQKSCCVCLRAGTVRVSLSRNDSENCHTVAAIHVFH